MGHIIFKFGRYDTNILLQGIIAFKVWCSILKPIMAWWCHIASQNLPGIVSGNSCCLMAPSHHLNQWLYISEFLWHSHEDNFTGIGWYTYTLYEFIDRRLQQHPLGVNVLIQWQNFFLTIHDMLYHNIQHSMKSHWTCICKPFLPWWKCDMGYIVQEK